MTTIHRIRRLIAILAAGAGALLALGAASPALAASTRVPAYGPPVGAAPVPAQVHTVIVAGMAGWQIALIALAAALAAAAVAVVLDRTRAARRSASATLT